MNSAQLKQLEELFREIDPEQLVAEISNIKHNYTTLALRDTHDITERKEIADHIFYLQKIKSTFQSINNLTQ